MTSKSCFPYCGGPPSCRQVAPELGFGADSTKIGRCGPHVGQSRPTYLTKLDQHCLTLAQLGPNLGPQSSTSSTHVGRMLLKSGQHQAEVGQPWPMSADGCRICWPNVANAGLTLAQIGQFWWEFARCWPNVDHIGQNLTRSANVGRIRAESRIPEQMFDNVGACHSS